MRNELVVFVYDHFYPDYSAGGPVTSLANLAALLKDEQIRILSSSCEFRSGKEISGIATNQWTVWKGLTVWYATNRKNIGKALSGLPVNSTLYLNGVFSFRYFLGVLWSSRKLKLNVVISPRGMLQEGAMKYGFMKKKVFLLLVKKLGLLKNVLWHATDVREAEDIRYWFNRNQRISVIQNVPRVSVAKPVSITKRAGRLKLVYFSLIARKKTFISFSTYFKTRTFLTWSLILSAP